MMVAAFLLALAAPSAEAERLGRELAAQGTLAGLLPLLRDKETAELLAEAKDLSPAERTRLRSIADATYAAGRSRIMAATGRAWAERLSIADLRRLVAHGRSPAARRAQAALPQVIAGSMGAIGPLDFKGDVRKGMCAQTGKMCEGR